MEESNDRVVSNELGPALEVTMKRREGQKKGSVESELSDYNCEAIPSSGLRLNV